MSNIIATIKMISAGFCGIICRFLGAWDMALKILLLFVAIDIITGVLKAVYNKQISSEDAYRGGIKKIGIFLVVCLACALDSYMNMTILRSCAIGYYIANEGLSIVENWGQMGLPLPAIIKTILIQLEEQSDKGGRSNEVN